MKKGAATPQLTEILIMVLMLLFFVMLLTSILSAFGGNEYASVRLNAELLRSKMGEACSLLATGSGSVKIDRLSIKQTTPYPTAAHRLIDIPGFLARTYIKLTGDPKYVLYYEAFPIGEAVGWEVYHDFDYRIIAPFDYSKQAGSDSGPINYIDFEREMYKGERSLVKQIQESADKAGVKATGTEPIKIIVNNIVLTSQLNPIPNEEPRQFAAAKISRSGEWKDLVSDNTNTRAKERDNTFEFSSYSLLTALEKTALKYRSCGDNSLCLKTANGVERLALPQSCGDIKYVQLEYENRAVLLGDVKVIGGAAVLVGAGYVAGAAGVTAAIGNVVRVSASGVTKIVSKIVRYPILGGAAAALAGNWLIENVFGPLFKNFLAYKSSDFYLASPCIAQDIEIQKVTCQSLCSKWMSYPIYDVTVNSRGERQYIKAGDHYQCIENIDGVQNANVQGPQGNCLKVLVKSSPEGFCWTADPTKKISGLSLSTFSDFQTQSLAWLFGFTPVKNSNLYVQGSQPSIALKPKSAVETGLTSIDDFLERRYIWSWPGSGEKIKPLTAPTPRGFDPNAP